MSLRFFSDQCVPAEITETRRRHCHHVTLLREVLPIRSPDPAVIAKRSRQDKKAHRFIPLRLDNGPINGFLANSFRSTP